MSTSKKADKSDMVWAIMSLISGFGAIKVTNKVLSSGWKASTGRKPPANPADPDVRLVEAVLWAAVTGATVALARMFAQRSAANYFVRSVGRLPKQLEKDGS